VGNMGGTKEKTTKGRKDVTRFFVKMLYRKKGGILGPTWKEMGTEGGFTKNDGGGTGRAGEGKV